MQLVQDGRDTFVSETDGCKQNASHRDLIQLPGSTARLVLPVTFAGMRTGGGDCFTRCHYSFTSVRKVLDGMNWTSN